MPKGLIIQTIVGFAICMIAMTLFVFGIFRTTLSTEFYQLTTDSAVTITPEPDRAYFISVESSYELIQPELELIHKYLIVTSDDPLGGFALLEAPGHARSSRTYLNTSTHKASVSRLMFDDNNPITLNISSTKLSPGQTLMIQSGNEPTLAGIVLLLVLLLIGLGAGFAAGIRIFIWTITKLVDNTSGASAHGAAG